MKAFDTLTRQGQIRRLRALAINALKHYPFKVAHLRLVGAYTNTLFRINTTHGATYILRVCVPRWRTADDLRAEVLWLQALSHDPEINAPEPICAQNGDLFVEACAKGVPEARRCVVMSWLPGTPLGKHLTETNLRKMGALFARLHDFSAQFSPPANFPTRKMDTLYARDEPEGFGDAALHHMSNDHSRTIFESTQTKVNETFGDLYRDQAGLRVIHNDLHHDNIHLYRGRLYPLDFEDTIWGYPVQDIAMALQDLMMDVPPGRFETLKGAFRAGYEDLHAWTECHDGHIDTLRAGRMLWVTNYVAWRERDYLEAHVAWLTPVLERYLATGKLRLQSRPGVRR